VAAPKSGGVKVGAESSRQREAKPRATWEGAKWEGLKVGSRQLAEVEKVEFRDQKSDKKIACQRARGLTNSLFANSV
jgi:hypothetical protein